MKSQAEVHVLILSLPPPPPEKKNRPLPGIGKLSMQTNMKIKCWHAPPDLSNNMCHREIVRVREGVSALGGTKFLFAMRNDVKRIYLFVVDECGS